MYVHLHVSIDYRLVIFLLLATLCTTYMYKLLQVVDLKFLSVFFVQLHPGACLECGVPVVQYIPDHGDRDHPHHQTDPRPLTPPLQQVHLTVFLSLHRHPLTHSESSDDRRHYTQYGGHQRSQESSVRGDRHLQKGKCKMEHRKLSLRVSVIVQYVTAVSN